MTPGLETEIVDQAAYGRNVERLHGAGVVLPRIAELADPVIQIAGKMERVATADPDAADPLKPFPGALAQRRRSSKGTGRGSRTYRAQRKRHRV